MSLRKLIARTISETIACGRLLAAPRPGLRILMYHAIGSPALGDRQGLFSMAPALFQQHIECLAAGFDEHVVVLTPGVEIKSQFDIAITFDDGYRDNLLVAAPILARHALPFTVFVSADFVREGRNGFLSPAELRELAAMPGAQIGAHGASHVSLSDCDDHQLQQELVSSRAYLEDIVGQAVVTMAYPYGAANRRVCNAAAAAGYQLAACSHAGINDPGRERLLLRRTEILGSDSIRTFQQKLKGDWDWYRWRTQDPAKR